MGLRSDERARPHAAHARRLRTPGSRGQCAGDVRAPGAAPLGSGLLTRGVGPGRRRERWTSGMACRSRVDPNANRPVDQRSALQPSLPESTPGGNPPNESRAANDRDTGGCEEGGPHALRRLVRGGTAQLWRRDPSRDGRRRPRQRPLQLPVGRGARNSVRATRQRRSREHRRCAIGTRSTRGPGHDRERRARGICVSSAGSTARGRVSPHVLWMATRWMDGVKLARCLTRRDQSDP